MLNELSQLFRPYVEMHLFHIVDSYVMGRQASREFLMIGAIIFLLALFYDPANRTGDRFWARVVFTMTVFGLVFYDRVMRPTKTTDPERLAS